ncbi:PepSY domain-containing protein [Rhodobacteraceae bacterium B1Z28]|uniref:PepSY domain-containing protein n=1 Tax=Ruegeria haliotis TaxID=2747601 RepID=A0ABX2PRE6_9RHOB|nr:PepSY domain-containing protein [Ruegeria haliotis]NVO56712.1 PepSY domain-containing protein [Ruegeria haliotis]
MKKLAALALASLISSPALADGVDAETVGKIEAYLASIECQMDPDDIEVEEDGYDLDDVICKGGDQFDIKLDKDLNEVSRKAE